MAERINRIQNGKQNRKIKLTHQIRFEWKITLLAMLQEEKKEKKHSKSESRAFKLKRQEEDEKKNVARRIQVDYGVGSRHHIKELKGLLFFYSFLPLLQSHTLDLSPHRVHFIFIKV